MHPEPNSQPESDEVAPSHTPSLHDMDERWTVPWALVESGDECDNNTALTWHGMTPAFSHAGYNIARPMLYASEGPSCDSEASCIDTTLPVGEPDFKNVERLPHWATYASLSPTQRANYLLWLASGRGMPLTDINYAFLYFYGLERYALIERGDPEEVLRILMRLLRKYDDNASFFSSASRLAAFLFATKGIEKLKPAWFDRLFVNRDVPLHADSISVALTWLYERGKPLPAPLAFEIARQDLRCPHTSEYYRNPGEFERRFSEAYQSQFGDGMPLERAEQDYTWKYRPVNPTLQSWEHFGKLWSISSTNVAAESAQFQPLVEIWRTCAGITAEVSAQSPWISLIDAQIGSDGRLLAPMGQLAKIAGLKISKSGSMTLAESDAIASVAASEGYEVLPNPQLLLRPFKWSERVALVRRPDAPSTDGEAYYLAGGLLLALGTAMAAEDGEVDHIEILHVSEIVNSLYHFNDYDKHRLGILRKRLLKFSPKLPSLTRRVRAILTEEELLRVGRFLVGVAGANFKISDEEMLALRKAYRAFGLPSDALESLLAEMVGAAGPDGKHGIQEDVLARLMRETKDFAVRLGDAMQQVEIGDEKDAKRGVWYVRKSSVPEAPASKPDPYRDALYALLQRPDWTEAEFIAIGEEHGVFVAGAVNAGDAWAAGAEECDGGVRIVVGSCDEDEAVE